jgi:F-type H+-transporting ATPase subunit epsilon
MNPESRLHLEVKIADVGQEVYAGRCFSLVAPAALGQVCILPRHAPFLSKLLPGEIRLETVESENLFYYVSGGYLEVKDSAVTVLADRMLRSAEIDQEAALTAKARAEELLRASLVESERDAARLELLKALAQLQVLQHVDMARLRKHGR